jgi:hypothetical protein
MGTVATVASLIPAVPLGAFPDTKVGSADLELQRLGAPLVRVHRVFDALEADPKSTDEDWEPHLAEEADLVPQILRLTATSREGVAIQATAAIRAVEICGKALTIATARSMRSGRSSRRWRAIAALRSRKNSRITSRSLRTVPRGHRARIRSFRRSSDTAKPTSTKWRTAA